LPHPKQNPKKTLVNPPSVKTNLTTKTEKCLTFLQISSIFLRISLFPDVFKATNHGPPIGVCHTATPRGTKGGMRRAKFQVVALHLTLTVRWIFCRIKIKSNQIQSNPSIRSIRSTNQSDQSNPIKSNQIKSTNQSDQSIRSINQSTNQSINRSVSQSIHEDESIFESNSVNQDESVMTTMTICIIPKSFLKNRLSPIFNPHPP